MTSWPCAASPNFGPTSSLAALAEALRIAKLEFPAVEDYIARGRS